MGERSMKDESDNAKWYAVELCEMWEIVNEIKTIISDCQGIRMENIRFLQNYDG